MAKNLKGPIPQQGMPIHAIEEFRLVLQPVVALVRKLGCHLGSTRLRNVSYNGLILQAQAHATSKSYPLEKLLKSIIVLKERSLKRLQHLICVLYKVVPPQELVLA
jgi:hypothetical protein